MDKDLIILLNSAEARHEVSILQQYYKYTYGVTNHFEFIELFMPFY